MSKCHATSISFIFLVALVLGSADPSFAGWVDDWMQNSTSSGPQYMSTQERGYYSLGGFDARWKSKSDYLMSITKPRLKMGCGGIDFYAGGMTFLQPNYLVKKLQAILQNAPAVALDLALKVLCQDCADSMKDFESMIDKLNALQLDDCKASKAVVAMAMDPNGENEQLNQVKNDWSVSSGVSSFYQSSVEDTTSTNNQPQAQDFSSASGDSMTSACPQIIQEIFTTPDAGSSSTILSNMGRLMGIDPSYIGLMAGLVGDVRILPPDGGYAAKAIEPCANNATLNDAVDSALLNGQAWAYDFSQDPPVCVQITDQSANLQNYVSSMLSNIYNDMVGKSRITNQAEIDFLQHSSGITYTALRTAVLQNDSSATTLSVFAPLIARDISINMLKDLLNKATALLSTAKDAISKNASADPNKISSSADVSKCQVALFTPDIVEIEKIEKRIQNTLTSLDAGYRRELERVNGMVAVYANVKSMEQQMLRDVARRFGDSAVAGMK
jgi:conjugative transfer pilus assembly protein TraH